MFSALKWFVLVLQGGAFVVIVLSDEPRQSQGRGLVDRKQVKAPPPPPPVNSFLSVPGRHFCFGSCVNLDVACCYIWFTHVIY